MINHRFVKIFTRKYSLLEDSLVNESLLKKNSCIKEIFYQATTVSSKDGIVSIYIPKEDIERNKKSIREALRKDSEYLTKKLAQGNVAIKNLTEVIENFNADKLSGEDLLAEYLRRLR